MWKPKGMGSIFDADHPKNGVRIPRLFTLGVGQSTITRHLRELEDAVGVPLLSRTTRRVTLTDEGSRFYEGSCSLFTRAGRAKTYCMPLAGLFLLSAETQ